MGDQIFWSNDDTEPHWPATVENATLFTEYQIAPKSTSVTFSPAQAQTIQYICSRHEGETGTITVSPKATQGSTT